MLCCVVLCGSSCGCTLPAVVIYVFSVGRLFRCVFCFGSERWVMIYVAVCRTKRTKIKATCQNNKYTFKETQALCVLGERMHGERLHQCVGGAPVASLCPGSMLMIIRPWLWAMKVSLERMNQSKWNTSLSRKGKVLHRRSIISHLGSRRTR